MSQFIKEDPIFVETLLNSLHVDYVNVRVSSVETDYEFYLKAKQKFAEGGFNLRKFRSNSREFNPFQVNVPILYPLKIPENKRLRREHWPEMGLTNSY